MACYNFDVHQTILTILAGMLPSKLEVKSQIFPPHLTSASAQPDKARKHENHIFSLKYCITVFSKRHRITLRLLYAMSRPSVCLSVVCDVGAPYSGG